MSEVKKPRYSVPRVVVKIHPDDLDYGRPHYLMTDELKAKLEMAKLAVKEPAPVTIYVVKDGRLELVKSKVAYVKKALRDTN